MSTLIDAAGEPGSRRGPSSWDKRQRDYWDGIAPSYDDLYQDPWSTHENALVTARLKRLLPADTTMVLDVGCGTGLGASLIGDALRGSFDYHGLDISPEMLDRCRARVPTAQLRTGTMTNLTDYGAGSFDAVTAFFGTASYAESVAAFLTNVLRILKPGGAMYLSFFGRWALRRLIRGRLSAVEIYDTRYAREATPPPVRVYSRSRLAALGNAALGASLIEGQGALAGFCEAPRLWRISTRLDRVIPSLCHQQELILRKRQRTSP